MILLTGICSYVTVFENSKLTKNSNIGYLRDSLLVFNARFNGLIQWFGKVGKGYLFPNLSLFGNCLWTVTGQRDT